jgi:hypothetical protein
LELTIRIGENELWARGVRIQEGDSAARYTAAREADPDFTAIRRLITQLIDRIGRLREMVLQVVGFCREGASLEAVRDRVQRHYDEMGAGVVQEPQEGVNGHI